MLERNGRCYLYMKTAERAHTPKDLWQKVRLSKEYDQALAQINEHLAHWPKFLVHKNKQRLTKITQMLIRMRRLAVRAAPKVVPLAARTEKRELRREAKALAAAPPFIMEAETFLRLSLLLAWPPPGEGESLSGRSG